MLIGHFGWQTLPGGNIFEVVYCCVPIQSSSKYAMVKSCCAVGCTNRILKGSGIQFYRFPSDCERRERWKTAIHHDDWEPTEYSYVCSVHFV